MSETAVDNDVFVDKSDQRCDTHWQSWPRTELQCLRWRFLFSQRAPQAVSFQRSRTSQELYNHSLHHTAYTTNSYDLYVS